MDTALVTLGVALLAALTGLVPYLGGAAKASLEAYTATQKTKAEAIHRQAINEAAETIAASDLVPRGDGTPLPMSDSVALLKRRVPDAIAALKVSDGTLADIITKRAVLLGIKP